MAAEKVELRKLKWPSTEAREFISALHRRQSVDEAQAGEKARKLSEKVFGEQLTPAQSVNRILRDVRREGDAALIKYTRLLDGVELSTDTFKVTEDELEEALKNAPEELVEALTVARENIMRYETELVERCGEIRMPLGGGGFVGAKFVPFKSAGIYVPGGTAAYPSSVLMNALPAIVAGVKRVALFTPPEPSPNVLAACALAGVKEVYRIGGVQAIAAMAYGTESIQPVDIVAGPGNIFVSLAKKQIYGDVAVDMIAGPSEILVIADETANAGDVAADMLSQAEHDPVSSAVVVTTSEAVAIAVAKELATQLAMLKRSETAAAAVKLFGAAIVVADTDEACEVANLIAPEHLEIMTKDPEALLPLITQAGAVFLGKWSPEPIGDYVAGPSHTLPTGGRARFSSGLSALTFLRKMSIISCTEEDLRSGMADAATHLALAEGLDAHARSIERRLH
jgi:histidinol dehydrogenase